MTDATNLIRIVQQRQPDETYNLSVQSHVQVSFETPEYTANADALGAKGLDRRNGKCVVEVDLLRGDRSKAHEKLRWRRASSAARRSTRISS